MRIWLSRSRLARVDQRQLERGQPGHQVIRRDPSVKCMGALMRTRMRIWGRMICKTGRSGRLGCGLAARSCDSHGQPKLTWPALVENPRRYSQEPVMVLPPVVVDGANVACQVGGGKHGSAEAVAAAVAFFRSRGHHCFAFLPAPWARAGESLRKLAVLHGSRLLRPLPSYVINFRAIMPCRRRSKRAYVHRVARAVSCDVTRRSCGSHASGVRR